MSRYVKPTVDVTKLVFIEEQPSEIKCGKCGKPMKFTIYYLDKESYDFLVCSDCEVYMQRVIYEE